MNGGRSAPFATPYMVGGEDRMTNNRTMQLQVTGPVKIELLKDAGLQFDFRFFSSDEFLKCFIGCSIS